VNELVLMVFIPSVLPARVTWESDNSKWKIVTKIDKHHAENFLQSWLLVQKRDKNGRWKNEYRRKHYPAYLQAKIIEFEVAIRNRKSQYLGGR
jgi:hypothetical protein